MRKFAFPALVLCAFMTFAAPRSALADCSAGSTVSNVNDCVPAGGGSRDCFHEFSVLPVPPIDPHTGLRSAKINCLDNDPSCDADTTPGQCTILVGSCVNVTDPRLSCTATSAASYLLKSPSAKDAAKPHKNPFNRDNRRNLDLGLGGLALPTGTGNLCTPLSRFVVPLRDPTHKGKGRIMVRLSDPAPETDSDQLKVTCLPNPALATIPCASARQITSTSELIGGPIAMGRVGDWLLENDKVRFIVRDLGRDFSFMLTYGGHPIDADLQRKLGPSTLTPPYPPGRDRFNAMTPLINISSSDNPTSIMVVNSGATGGPAKIRTSGPDDLFDPIDPNVAIRGFNAALQVPPPAVDNNIPVNVVNDYTLNCGDDFLQIDTTVNNLSGSGLTIYTGDYITGGGQREYVGPGLGFGEGTVRAGNNFGPIPFNYIGWMGYDQGQGVSYAVIPQTWDHTSSFAQSGVVVPLYGSSVIGVLFAGDPGVFTVPASGANTFSRWFGVSDNGMGRIVDARNRLAARGDITPPVDTGYIRGTVSVDGTPVDGARVVVYKNPGNSGSQFGVIDVFETKDGGYYQGTLPRGDYSVAAKLPGHLYENGDSDPTGHPITIGGATTTLDFDIPQTGYVRVLVKNGETSTPLAGKVSVVGLDAAPDPGITENVPFLAQSGNVFGYDAREKVTIYGLPQVQFAGTGGDTGVFKLPPGDYQIVVSHGPEWSVSKTPLTVVAGSPGSPQTVNANVFRVVDTTGFISSDYHVHMQNSQDSVVTKNERITTMLAEGVDYFVASDHDFLTDLTADVAALGASSLIKTAVSDEITYFDSGHFGAFPLNTVPSSVTNGAIDWGDATAPVGLGYPSDGSFDLSPNDMVLLAKGPPYNAKVVQANHFNSGTLGFFRLHGIDTTVVPPQSSTPPAAVRQAPTGNLYTNELTALELWIENTRSQNALATGENLGDWFNMLNNFSNASVDAAKLRKTATFDSDTHSTTVVQAGGPRNMVASPTDDPALIDPDTLADNLNDGRNIGTNGPFPRVTVVGNVAPPASHALGSPLLVKATTGTATVNVDIQSPEWARFDRVEIFVNNTPTCSTVGPNFVGGSKKLCTPVANFTLNVTPTLVTLPNTGTRWEASVSQPLTGLTQDSWVVVMVRGTDFNGFTGSPPLFPMAPQSILPRSCSGDPCRPCSASQPCGVFFGTCTISNQTTAELSDGNLGQCGVTALAIANPLFIDFDGDGLYKGVALP